MLAGLMPPPITRKPDQPISAAGSELNRTAHGSVFAFSAGSSSVRCSPIAAICCANCIVASMTPNTSSDCDELSLGSDVPLVAAGDVHYHTADRMLVHDCVTAIRHGTTIDKVHQDRFANSQRHLRSLDEIAELYRDVPDAIARTVEIAERCTFTLDELRYEYPEEIAPPGMTLIEHLKRLTWEGATERWPGGVPAKVIELLRHEMRDHRRTALRSLLLDRLGHGPVCPRAEHLVPGSRFGRQLGGLLLPWRHQRGPQPIGSCCSSDLSAANETKHPTSTSTSSINVAKRCCSICTKSMAAIARG